MAEQYPPSLVLSAIADHLDRHHSEIRVTLPTNRFTLQQGLSAILDCLGELSDHVSLPTSNPARRQALRLQALENKNAFDEARPFSSTRQIRVPGNLKPEDHPPSPSPNRRALLKQKFLDEDGPPFRDLSS
ncbi:hypothetical protein ASPVEDRAFT_34730 [Aspergillus versicolor CBS 583.65]|uniref:Uncharacterized protein n=1 Tax=Aspergillus versicolor CBS 583.65 TaxID=1036611 RepID=A0A1L9Q4C8_ASPVE|nr:uncharacterized protein ASPVEDRAFT_34730 [Aspergillus versicolor CBS 583.65]OJJ08589.1 hypothetical protein ASPVEDRAFT_34730 [Aspergillus versicolor CBS 583.65]